MQQDYDIVIAGGGMVGASLAIALADTGLSIAVIEPVLADAEQQPSYDDRGIGLSLSSKRIFQGLGVWSEVAGAANPIRHIHVSDRGHFGKVRMHAEQLGLESLGHVVIARELGKVLLHRVKSQENVDFICPAKVENFRQTGDGVDLQLQAKNAPASLRCSLLVAADGTDSGIRQQQDIVTKEHDYRQSLVVSNISSKNPHNDTAYERFTEDGPLALLPLQSDRYVLVFSCSAEMTEHYLSLPDDEFLEEVRQRMGRRVGRIFKLGKRRAYPVRSVMADQQLSGRVLLLGNAAHTIHPNGAQGFNLCLRDVACLAEKLAEADQQKLDPGNAMLLGEYLQERKADQHRVSEQSHNITRWFYNRNSGLALVRNLAMTLLDLSPAARQELMRRGMGISGKQPGLVRGLVT